MKRIYNILLILTLALYGSAFTAAVFAQAPALAPSSSPTTQKPNSSLPLTLPLREGSVRFLAVGDTGRGNREQNELAQVMFNYRQAFPYEFVILTGDNIYYQEKAEDLKTKFENVYKPILNSGVKFYASLGNHDESNQRFYEHFNMNGQEYYRIEKGGVSFYALNSTYMDKRQIEWMEAELAKDTAKWKIAFFHHPPYSSGKRHGSAEDIRAIVEPIFLKHGVDVVFTGHEHFYERVKPQKGIYYFVTGAGGEVRKNNIKKKSELTEKGFDTDLSFMLVEISKDEMHFQVISRAGATVDSGVIPRRD
ncbi:MAG TPA: metallophosphoesterase [Pyrinomonadaceae bacterium]|nr:metallophosphoesterase [Pyrinomonadaceae bacterium]